jgi:hypothetical protein
MRERPQAAGQRVGLASEGMFLHRLSTIDDLTASAKGQLPRRDELVGPSELVMSV